MDVLIFVWKNSPSLTTVGAIVDVDDIACDFWKLTSGLDDDDGVVDKLQLVIFYLASTFHLLTLGTLD